MTETVTVDLDYYLELKAKAESVLDDSQTNYVLDLLWEIIKRNPQLKQSDISGALFHPKFFINYSPVIGSNENPLKIVKK